MRPSSTLPLLLQVFAAAVAYSRLYSLATDMVVRYTDGSPSSPSPWKTLCTLVPPENTTVRAGVVVGSDPAMMFVFVRSATAQGPEVRLRRVTLSSVRECLWGSSGVVYSDVADVLAAAWDWRSSLLVFTSVESDSTVSLRSARADGSPAAVLWSSLCQSECTQEIGRPNCNFAALAPWPSGGSAEYIAHEVPSSTLWSINLGGHRCTRLRSANLSAITLDSSRVHAEAMAADPASGAVYLSVLPSGTGPKVVVNEVMFASNAVASDGMAELFNRELIPVDLAGWTVRFGDSVNTYGQTVQSLSLRPRQYLSIGRAGANWTHSTAWTQPAWGFVSVLEPTGQVVDTVAWGGASASYRGEGTALESGAFGKSFCRIPDGWDTANNSVNFRLLDRPNIGSENTFTAGAITGHLPERMLVFTQSPAGGDSSAVLRGLSTTTCEWDSTEIPYSVRDVLGATWDWRSSLLVFTAVEDDGAVSLFTAKGDGQSNGVQWRSACRMQCIKATGQPQCLFSGLAPWASGNSSRMFVAHEVPSNTLWLLDLGRHSCSALPAPQMPRLALDGLRHADAMAADPAESGVLYLSVLPTNSSRARVVVNEVAFEKGAVELFNRDFVPLRKNYMRSTLLRADEELEDRVAFHGTRPENVESMCNKGLLRVGHPLNPSHSTDPGFFGDPRHGVYASRFVEYTLQYSNMQYLSANESVPVPLAEGDSVRIVMFKALPGRSMHMHSLAGSVLPTPGYDSHSSPEWLEWYLFDETQLCPQYVVELRAITNERTGANDGLPHW
eukprot:m51a1_g598 hypothetical protein (783) ;mRNA; r:64378-70336